MVEKIKITDIELTVQIQCPDCNGKKKVGSSACKKCGGKGTTKKHLTLTELQELLAEL